MSTQNSLDPTMNRLPTAADWDAWYRDGRRRLIPPVEYAKLHQRVRPQPGMTAVDLGCGTGQWARQLHAWGMRARLRLLHRGPGAGP